MERAKDSDDPTTGRVPDTFKQHYAGTFVAQRYHAYNDPISQGSQTNQPKGEPLPMEFKRIVEWFNTLNHDGVTALFTVGIFIATAIYAVVATLQWCTMGGQLEQMRQQTTLTRQQLIGTQSAVVAFSDRAPGVSLSTPKSSIDFTLKNLGNVNATDVHVNLSIRRVSVPELGVIGKPDEAEIVVPVLQPSRDAPSIWLPRHRQEFDMTQTELKLMRDFSQTVEMVGSIAYNDGFDNPRHETFCFRLLIYETKFSSATNVENCDGWSMAYSGALDTIKNSQSVHKGQP